jgi:hypothetical protein
MAFKHKHVSKRHEEDTWSNHPLSAKSEHKKRGGFRRRKEPRSATLRLSAMCRDLPLN